MAYFSRRCEKYAALRRVADWRRYHQRHRSRAGVAELADAPGLGPGGLRPLEVRFLSPASPKPRRRAGAESEARGRRSGCVALTAIEADE